MSAELLAIGAIAEATGVSVSALRYYDEIGLIHTAGRVGDKRRFAPEVAGRVNFIRRAVDVGFSLDDVRAILDDTAGSWREHVDSKLAELEERRQQLDEMIEALGEIRSCGCDVVLDCPQAPLGSKSDCRD